jgi:hypothetical protein
MTDYLWDGKGRPDERIAELEALLSRFRRPAPPAAPRPSSVSGKRPAARPAPEGYEIGWGWYVAAAALLAIFAIGAAVRFFEARRAREWTIVDARGSKKLVRGESIRTAPGKTARLESAAVGVVELAENTTLTLLEVRDGRTSLDLSAGTIHARTTSPPGVFVVQTPRGRAIDLGCEYTLRVEPGRGGRVHVDSGWVELSRVGQQSLVPAAASAVFDATGRLTPPWFDDAQAEFGEAVRRFALPPEVPIDAVARVRALDRILTLARRRDGLTLIGPDPGSPARRPHPHRAPGGAGRDAGGAPPDPRPPERPRASAARRHEGARRRRRDVRPGRVVAARPGGGGRSAAPEEEDRRGSSRGLLSGLAPAT